MSMIATVLKHTYGQMVRDHNLSDNNETTARGNQNAESKMMRQVRNQENRCFANNIVDNIDDSWAAFSSMTLAFY